MTGAWSGVLSCGGVMGTSGCDCCVADGGVVVTVVGGSLTIIGVWHGTTL